MYYGEFQSRLDDKNRITVPTRFRETMNVLGHAIWHMTRGFDGCIFLFHQDEWRRVCSLIDRYPAMGAQALDFRRMWYSSAVEVRPDPQGRIPVPAALRDMAGLDKDVVLFGVGDHLEIWDKETWRTFQRSKEAEYKATGSLLLTGEQPRWGVAEKGVEG